MFFRFVFISLFLLNCSPQHFGKLKFVCDLPSVLEEASSVETIPGSDLYWTQNDSGNSPIIYGINAKGQIIKQVYVQGKNKDWEDLTKDPEGNLYIGDFGNNANKRKHLKIYKVSHHDLLNEKSVVPEEITFKFPHQTKFPPKKKSRHFDIESFFYFKGNLYLFTKSRVKGNFGRTDLYRIPAIKGDYKATRINSFTTCNDMNCWVTSATISPDGKKVALLSHHNIWLFTDFKDDDFLSGKVEKIELGHDSQKEGICFETDEKILITDEYAHGEGGNLYSYDLTKK